ncbi:hypothetical protein T484DRAFT_1858200 [Baffinella frigidus]|nr:hypothetical protein T484DRAFT_1858200 [Cryptophyta sp. CCMP2293]
MQFADAFFERFRSGVRHDPQDKGGEYRSVLGLPDGINSRFIGAFKTLLKL